MDANRGSSPNSSFFFPFGSLLSSRQQQQRGPANSTSTLDTDTTTTAPGRNRNWSESLASLSATADEVTTTGDTTKPRMKGRDLYGGRLMYGGTNNSASHFYLSSSYLRRSNRLLAASTPYYSAARFAASSRRAVAANETAVSSTGGLGSHRPSKDESSTDLAMLSSSRPNQQPSPSSAASSASNSRTSSPGMSSTAKMILDTLEKMSTPLRDAQKIPVPRAERRRRIAEELLEGTGGGSFSVGLLRGGRRRPSLSAKPGGSAGFLGGPPVRSRLFTPVTVSPIKRRTKLAELIPKEKKKKGELPASDYKPEGFSFANFNSTEEKKDAAEKDNNAAKPGFFPTIFAPALMGNGSKTSAAAAAASATTSLVGGDTPKTAKNVGKIRAKVGDKARARAERAFFNDNSQEEEDKARNDLPSYLSASGVNNNPFADMSTLPTFDFSAPKSKASQKEKVTDEEKSSSTPSPEMLNKDLSSPSSLMSSSSTSSPMESGDEGNSEAPGPDPENKGASKSPQTNTSQLLTNGLENSKAANVAATEGETEAAKKNHITASAKMTAKSVRFIFSPPEKFPLSAASSAQVRKVLVEEDRAKSRESFHFSKPEVVAAPRTEEDS